MQAGHLKEFKLYSESSGEPLKSYQLEGPPHTHRHTPERVLKEGDVLIRLQAVSILTWGSGGLEETKQSWSCPQS